jgi:hypothetical protein
MEMPKVLERFLSDAQWSGLKLESLSKEDREDVVGFLVDVFAGENPDSWDKDDIAEVVLAAKEVAGMLGEEVDEEISDDDLVAAAQTAEALPGAEK